MHRSLQRSLYLRRFKWQKRNEKNNYLRRFRNPRDKPSARKISSKHRNLQSLRSNIHRYVAPSIWFPSTYRCQTPNFRLGNLILLEGVCLLRKSDKSGIFTFETLNVDTWNVFIGTLLPSLPCAIDNYCQFQKWSTYDTIGSRGYIQIIGRNSCKLVFNHFNPTPWICKETSITRQQRKHLKYIYILANLRMNV